MHCYAPFYRGFVEDQPETLPIYFRAASLLLQQSYDCPSADEITLRDGGKMDG